MDGTPSGAHLATKGASCVGSGMADPDAPCRPYHGVSIIHLFGLTVIPRVGKKDGHTSTPNEEMKLDCQDLSGLVLARCSCRLFECLGDYMWPEVDHCGLGWRCLPSPSPVTLNPNTASTDHGLVIDRNLVLDDRESITYAAMHREFITYAARVGLPNARKPRISEDAMEPGPGKYGRSNTYAAAAANVHALEVESTAYGETLERVEVFKYLGRLMAMDDNDMHAVRSDIPT
ncbi:hypothetical protein THAOC_31920 [Thalassiosira oceanica]|uniref:Uncharacterized protein n=1 Tax=Thalassiosira oceanica TaxID=159749 RepID=K0R762_THAOC|nr:hypothetical protein THAOC_31920 [Thalassiosira oceanica]|eukprot:EJK49228.1 hypothetical protein THAOC_31920 [Thalassiosira oceanica]